MVYYVNFQYRPKDAERPEDEPVVKLDGKEVNARDIIINKGALPIIGDHVIFLRATNGTPVAQQVLGVVESRLFDFILPDVCSVNIVVTDSDTPSQRLIKQ